MRKRQRRRSIRQNIHPTILRTGDEDPGGRERAFLEVEIGCFVSDEELHVDGNGEIFHDAFAGLESVIRGERVVIAEVGVEGFPHEEPGSQWIGFHAPVHVATFVVAVFAFVVVQPETKQQHESISNKTKTWKGEKKVLECAKIPTNQSDRHS